MTRVWQRLDESLKKDVQQMVEEKKEAASGPVDAQTANSNFMKHRRVEGQLETALNEIIQQKDFYDEAIWGDKRLNPEAREMLEEGTENLTDERHRRLNRLLMANTFPGKVKRGSGNALEIWYGPWQWQGMTFAISYNQFANATLQTVTWVFDKFVMSIGLFIAILVTANFIPETFLPGSLNLLLSKPISRWGLLLAKFAGGCAFVTLCAVYLFLGLWLWLGFAMDIWDPGILWAIPLYIIVFAIYYSVSTFIGVWSRSPILSIIVTALFWAACFGVGLTYQMFDGRIDNSRTRGLVAVNDDVLHIGELNAVETWNDNDRDWEKNLEIKMMEEQRIAMGAVMFVPGAGDDNDLNLVGPVYDPKQDVVLSGVINLGNPGTMHHQDLFIASADTLKFEEIGKFPRDAIQAVSDDHGVIVFTRDGRFWRYVGKIVPGENRAGNNDPASSDSDKKESKNSPLGSLAGSLFGNRNKPKQPELFEDISPENLTSVFSGRAIAHNPISNNVFVFKDDKLIQFQLGEDGKYERGVETAVKSSGTTIVAAGGKTVIVALANGNIVAFDDDTLEEIQTWRPQDKSPFTNVTASADGRYFAILCRDRTLWLLDNQNPQTIDQANLSWQGNINAADFDKQNRLWVANRSNQVQLVELSNFKSIKTHAPPTGWVTRAFEYGVKPIYWLFPKPGEFYKIIAHLTSNPEDAEDQVDLQGLSDAPDPWQPLWSGLLFMCFVLFITGLIFQFRDY